MRRIKKAVDMWGGVDKRRLLRCNRGWQLCSPGMVSENVLEAEISIIQLAGCLDLSYSLYKSIRNREAEHLLILWD